MIDVQLTTPKNRKGRFCDGRSRRQFLRVGSLAIGGLNLAHLNQLDAAALASGKPTRKHKSVIMVYLSGGMSHQDTFDLKMDSPAEIRGEFKPIQSSVPGIQYGELLPKLSAIADKYTIIRSLVGFRDEHSSWQNLTGFQMGLAQAQGKPHFGSVVNRVLGPVDPIVPPFVDLFPTMQHKPYNAADAGMLGTTMRGSKMSGDDLALYQQTEVSPDRFQQRAGLLGNIDKLGSGSWEAPSLTGMETNYQRAFEVLTSSKVADAMNVEKEDPRVRDRYGKGSAKHLGDGAPMWNDQLLIARRLVETGARVVTVAYGFWDTHGNNFKHLKNHMPLFDTGISALIQDIHDRGMQDDVAVVVWGEFGRTPKINKDAGRDHWAPVNFALMAGGGFQVGQTIGATDKNGAYVSAQPIHYHDVLATVYHHLGVDPTGFVHDVSNRPVPILPGTASVIRQIV
jgi:hypothetical protein